MVSIQGMLLVVGILRLIVGIPQALIALKKLSQKK